MKKRLILKTLCMTLLLSACSSMEGKLTELTNSVSNNEQVNDIDKYNSYIDLLNYHNGWLAGMTQVYFENFGIDEKIDPDADYETFTLDGKDVDIYDIHKDTSKKPREYASSEPDYGESDDKMLVFCDKMDAFMKLYFNDVNDYYTNKEYEKDNLARGQELHEQMIKSYTEMLDAADGFLIVFSDKMIEEESADLPKFKEVGYDIHYYALSVLLKGREISNMFRKLEEEGTDFLEADLEQYQQLYDEFINNIIELDKIYNDSSKQSKEGYAAINASFLGQFVDTSKMMQTYATDTLNMIKAGTTEIENEMTGKVTTGGRTYPMSEFDRLLEMLIGQYNQSVS